MPVTHPAITAISSPSLRKRYKDLLRSEWSLDSLESTLTLLWDEIKDNADATGFAWWTMLQPPGQETLPRKTDPLVLSNIRYFSGIMRDPSLPQVPAGFTGVGNPHATIAPMAKLIETSWTYLILESLIDIKGERDFFRDIQSMLFLCVVDYLLPEMEKTASFTPERDVLVNALSFNAFAIWRDSPAHQYFLNSLIMNHLRQYGLRFEYLRRSLMLTPVEDHSYLTKAQALWSDLFDLERYAEAETFLLDLHRYSPTAHLSEVKEMIHSLYTASAGKW